jgi:protein SCO1/2
MCVRKISILACFGILFSIFYACSDTGKKAVSVKRVVNGKIVEDTTTYTAPAFKFINQFGDTVAQTDIAGKIFIADFFFIHCPSICPKMKAQMLRVYEQYRNNKDFLILSHTIDPKRDTVEALNAYAKKLGVGDGWYFLTGDKDELFAIADKYLISAEEDPASPGGFAHSGNFILVDKQGNIRGYYDGTDEESVTKLIKDIEKLQ